jgi:hypothetical protein
MKYLFFFKGQPLLLCCVCCKIAIQDFLRGLHKKNKKNLPFHRRIYQRNITHRYFTESCKKITGFCHIHRRIFRRSYRRVVARMSDTCPSALSPTAFPTFNTDGITDGPCMSDTCPSTRIPTAFPMELPTDRKVWWDFRFFWCAFQLISDGN